jgi:hypothetical protein
MLQIGTPQDFIELDVPELAGGGFGNDIMHRRCHALAVDGVEFPHLSQYDRAQLVEIYTDHRSILSGRALSASAPKGKSTG